MRADCNTVYLLSTCCGVLVGVAVVFDIVVRFLCYGINPFVMGQLVNANRPLRNARRHTTEHNKNYAILKFPQTYPGLGTPTDSGTFAGNLN